MPMRRFCDLVNDFDEFPPLYVVGRAFVTMPKDGGRVPDHIKKKAMKNVVGEGLKAPDWYKKGTEKIKELMKRG